MARPSDFETLCSIRDEIFPLKELRVWLRDDECDGWECHMCGLKSADAGEDIDIEYIMGKKLCSRCYLNIPRFARMMVEGVYLEDDAYYYSTKYERLQGTIENNAIAMNDYAPSVEIGWSQPDWDSNLTDEWIAGYQDHLRRIRIGLEIMFRKERMSDENRNILLGLHARRKEKTNDDLVFEMLEIIDKLKETNSMNDNDYLILCNNLKKIREQLMLIRR